MGIPKIIADKCTGCEECVESCPAECISMKDNIAVIEEPECTECGACVDDCPEGAIED